MNRWVIWAAGTIIMCAAAVGLASALLSRAACRLATKNGTVRDFHQFTGEELERDVRDRAPLGSSREVVEGLLSKEGMKFSYDRTLNATLASAPCLKGSGIVMKSLGLTFQFDNESKLSSIEARVHLTGP